MYKVKSLISIEDDEEVKRKQEEIRLKKEIIKEIVVLKVLEVVIMVELVDLFIV